MFLVFLEVYFYELFLKLEQTNKFIVPYLSKYYGQDKNDLSHKRRLTIEDHKTIYKQRKSEPR